MKIKKIELGVSGVQGCFLGLILFAVSLVMLTTAKTADVFTGNTGYLILFIIAEIAVGILFSLLRNHPRKDTKESGKISGKMFAGFGGMVLLYTVFFLFSDVTIFFSDEVRMIIGVNLVVLFIREIGEYCYTRRLSRELNQTLPTHSRSLIIDLPSCPKTKGEYLDTIIKQAEKNHLTLEILTDEYPAVVKLNNIPHKAEIESWYGFGGLEYSLKFHETTLK